MTRRRICRPELRLLIIHILNGVLQIAEHHVASLQAFSNTCSQSSPVRKIPQRLKRAVGAEKRVTAAADHLKGHVVQRSKGRDGAEVYVLPVDKRADQ